MIPIPLFIMMLLPFGTRVTVLKFQYDNIIHFDPSGNLQCLDRLAYRL